MYCIIVSLREKRRINRKKMLLKKTINITVNPIYPYIIILVLSKIRNIITQKINNVFYLIALIILQFRNVHIVYYLKILNTTTMLN